MTNLPDSLLTIDEVTAMLRLSHATIWRHIKAGILPPPIKIGGATRWRRSQIQAVIADAE